MEPLYMMPIEALNELHRVARANGWDQVALDVEDTVTGAADGVSH